MSTFSGKINECDWISIDQFEGENLKSRAFFLSHFHKDHCRGLDSQSFRRLLEHGCRLYTHRHTKQLILYSGYYDFQNDWIVGLDTNRAVTISPPGTSNERTSLVVTCFPARHCLGSVMMLFEIDGQAALYTGDFRLSAADWKTPSFAKLAMRPYGNRERAIDSLYFDSTFYNVDRMADREESKKEVIKLAREHLEKDERNRVLLWGSAHYGHEFIVKALVEEFKESCHVPQSKLEIYRQIQDEGLQQAVSGSCDARIHACKYYSGRDVEDSDDYNEITYSPTKRRKQADLECGLPIEHTLIIKISMQQFAMDNSERMSCTRVDSRTGITFTNVQYSCHSGKAEIEELFKATRPVRAFANVNRGGKDVAKEFSRFLTHRHTFTPSSSSSTNPWNSEIAARRQLIVSLQQRQASLAAVFTPNLDNCPRTN